MKNRKNKIVSTIQLITFLLIYLSIISAFILNAYSLIKLSSQFAFIINALVFIPMGIFGLINNELSLKNATPLAYSKSSIVGKVANVLIIIFGLVNLIIGIISLNSTT